MRRDEQIGNFFVETNNEPKEIGAEVRELLAATAGSWTGCDWITSYGPMKLNLRGLRSRQAHRISDYTSAEESVCWAEAARYLEQIERDAAKQKRSPTKRFCWCSMAVMQKLGRLSIRPFVAMEAKYRDRSFGGNSKMRCAGIDLRSAINFLAVCTGECEAFRPVSHNSCLWPSDCFRESSSCRSAA